MAHGTEHHLEEAHHAEHASHDDFNKRVAMSMAIIAATLAFITLLSHRSHNEVLQAKNDANMKKTAAANRWSQFQSKNIRRHEYKAFAEMLSLQATADHKSEAEKLIQDYNKKVKEYDMKVEDEKDKDDPKGLEGISKLAEGLDKDAEQLIKKSEHIHHTADRFDLGELGIELALVVCSVSVLTKNKLFWIAGLIFGTIGFVVALSAFIPALMAHEAAHETPHEAQPEKKAGHVYLMPSESGSLKMDHTI